MSIYRRSRNNSGANGLCRSPEYTAWQKMIQRCEDADGDHFDRYGGRGIRVCARWRDDFRAFLADMGPRPTSMHSIDRSNREGNYEPGNCRWATRKEQARNKSSNRQITAFGETLCLAAWAERFGLPRKTISDRLKLEWTPERAVSEPSHWRGQKARSVEPERFDGLVDELPEVA